MSSLSFSKMQALGNDFVVINATKEPYCPDTRSIQALAHRHIGIGFDQLLLLEPSQQADFFCRIFNSDGSEAMQCGNGLRCLARFIEEEHLSDKKTLLIETLSGITEIKIDADTIQVNMGLPRFTPTDIPFLPDRWDSSLPLATALSMGNPHAIIIVPRLDDYPILETASRVLRSEAFPHGVNIGFMEILDADRIRLCTIERGAGKTLSCGSNASAAVVAGIRQGQLNHSVTVELPLGNLFVEWSGKSDSSVFLSGPAITVFKGQAQKTISH